MAYDDDINIYMPSALAIITMLYLTPPTQFLVELDDDQDHRLLDNTPRKFRLSLGENNIPLFCVDTTIPTLEPWGTQIPYDSKFSSCYKSSNHLKNNATSNFSVCDVVVHLLDI